MSRVGSSAITIPDNVTVSQQEGWVIVKGKNGELSAPLHSAVELSISDNVATLKPKSKTKLAHSLWGTMRASINNMVVGVDLGFYLGFGLWVNWGLGIWDSGSLGIVD